MKNSWFNFIPCLLLAASIWFVHNLSQSYADIVNVTVLPSSNIDGRAEFANSEVTISARCKASGWRLISLGKQKKKVRTVYFDSSDLSHASGDRYTISPAALVKYSDVVFGDGVNVESFVTDNVTMEFSAENHKRVPVVPVLSASYKPQYMATVPVKMVPDSVVIYGEESRLSSIDAVYTKQINLKELRSSVHSDVRLEKPAGTRMSHEKATYSIEVTRFVELRSRVSIGTRHVPANTHLTVLPSTADVVYRCVFPIHGNPVDRTEFYIDYKEFAKSINGNCLIRYDGLPDGVIEVQVTPELCECVAD